MQPIPVPAPGLPARARRFDLGVVLAGLVVVLVALVRAFGEPRLGAGWPGAAELLLAVPLTAFLGTKGLPLARSGGAVSVALDSAVLVLLAWTVPAATGLLAWLVGVALAELLIRERRWSSRAFNLGLSGLAGLALLLVVRGLDADLAVFDLVDLVALVLGTSAYFAVDLVLTSLSVAWAEQVPLRATLADESAPVAAFAVLAVNAVGLLAALLAAMAPWSVLLLVPVLAAPLYAARASATATTERLRTAALFDAAAATQAATDREALRQAVVDAATRLTGSARAVLGALPPGAHQLGARVGDTLWLVVDERAAGNAFSAADLTGLQVLAALAAQALDRLELLAAMRHAASSDALTGLANRREVERALGDAVAASEATGRGRPGVVYLDLNGFKAVNDTHGHGVGDELLVAISRRLLASVREHDVVARWGGDEFVVLLRDTDEELALGTAARLRTAIEGDVSLMDTAGVVLRISASAGIALHRPGGTPQELLAAADAAMYDVKHRGA